MAVCLRQLFLCYPAHLYPDRSIIQPLNKIPSTNPSRVPKRKATEQPHTNRKTKSKVSLGSLVDVHCNWRNERATVIELGTNGAFLVIFDVNGFKEWISPKRSYKIVFRANG